ncbi:MAG: hypothetical protein HY931_02455 [Candidatus Falkowbacteria bacterium]|nr:MAG: hypothetical protein HY931_02455 [Candidatus Falkowbacteria bacterium]
MFYIKGTIKDDKIENFTRKDGTPGQKRLLYIEPLNSIYPITVNVPLNKDYGKIGAKVEVEVKVYPFSFVNKERQRAFLSVYVPEEETDKK